MMELEQAVKANRAWACYDCGKCTATCPISRAGDQEYSPRRHVLSANLGDRQDIVGNASLWSCLTCKLCDRRCPAQVEYTNLVLNLRELTHREGVEPECPHVGALQSVMRMMATGGAQQDRMGWVTSDLQIETRKGDVIYWTGCTMYYDAFFPDLKVATLDGTRAAVRLMNETGVKPVVSPEERCCGHDLLWNGDRKGFDKLAEFNVKLVEESGATTLVTSCAECLRTWKVDYEPFFKSKPPNMLHISEYLADKMEGLNMREGESRQVTFQDPCRLGRHLGIYDPPRQVLEAVPGIELNDMRKSGPGATCCAGGTWSNCDRYAKKIQVERLREARATGAEVLVTACPKCQVHFRCAMKDPNLGDDIQIELKDVAEIVVEALS